MTTELQKLRAALKHPLPVPEAMNGILAMKIATPQQWPHL